MSHEMPSPEAGRRGVDPGRRVYLSPEGRMTNSPHPYGEPHPQEVKLDAKELVAKLIASGIQETEIEKRTSATDPKNFTFAGAGSLEDILAVHKKRVIDAEQRAIEKQEEVRMLQEGLQAIKNDKRPEQGFIQAIEQQRDSAAKALSDFYEAENSKPGGASPEALDVRRAYLVAFQNLLNEIEGLSP